MNEDVFPIEHGDFPTSHVSFQVVFSGNSKTAALHFLLRQDECMEPLCPHSVGTNRAHPGHRRRPL